MLTLSREEFLSDFWDFRPGEHVSLLEPTRGGKTYLMMQLLEAAMEQNPHLRIVSLMPKPRDPATVKWKDQLGFKEIHHWPPPRVMPWQTKPAGFVLWPRHNPDNEDLNREHLGGQFRRALNSQYWEGDSITLADDVHILATLYGLNPELERHWTAGAGGGAAIWSANQKPSGTLGGGSVSSFMYNAPTHLFLGRDRDERNVKRFGEIGGVDPKEIESAVKDLRMFHVNGATVSEKLYIDRRGPYLARISL